MCFGTPLRTGLNGSSVSSGNDEALQTRSVTIDWYAGHANELFDDAETLSRYLDAVCDYVTSSITISPRRRGVAT